VRALDAADLALLDEEKGSRTPALKRLSDRHHALARCEAIGLDYVSCSPFRTPIARLAAAQAALGEREKDR
jgi:hypothetical protein